MGYAENELSVGRGGGGESISDQSRFVDCLILVRLIHFS